MLRTRNGQVRPTPEDSTESGRHHAYGQIQRSCRSSGWAGWARFAGTLHGAGYQTVQRAPKPRADRSASSTSLGESPSGTRRLASAVDVTSKVGRSASPLPVVRGSAGPLRCRTCGPALNRCTSIARVARIRSAPLADSRFQTEGKGYSPKVQRLG